MRQGDVSRNRTIRRRSLLTRRGVPFLVLALATSFCLGIYAELFHDAVCLARTGEAIGLFTSLLPSDSMLRIAKYFILSFTVLYGLSCIPGFFRWVVRYRVIIGACVVVACVVLKISGSSVALWGSGYEGTLFGIPRSIRSDEWVVFTPFSFSQSVSGNQAISSLLRGGNTDVTLVYGQPCWAIATLYRPFLWGYLFMDPERGLAFFWTARLVVIFLVTFELARLLSEGDDALACLAAMLVTFSPQVQWWFAVNGTAELLIFGQGLVLLLDRLLRARSRLPRLGYAALLSWSLCCYAFILYPSWQIPFIYVFGGLGIWVIVRWIREQDDARTIKASALQSIFMLIPSLALFGGLATMAVLGSWNVLQCVKGTVYPGSRLETGGGLSSWLANTTTTLVSPISADAYSPNVCEAATFFALFPLGLIMAVVMAIRYRDLGLICLLVPEAILLTYGFFGFPIWLSKAMLLSNVQTGRLLFSLGYLDVVMLIRAVAVGQSRDAAQVTRGTMRRCSRVLPSVLISLAFSLVLVIVACLTAPLAMGGWQCLITFAVTFVMSWMAIVPCSVAERLKIQRGQSMVMAASVVVLAGLCVNPVQQGAAALTKSDLATTIQEVVSDSHEATWLSDNSVVSQCLVANGASVINSVNTYPNLGLWSALDSDGSYSDVYNRYAYIDCAIGDETNFELIFPDHFAVTLTADDIRATGATYWLSAKDLTVWNTDDVSFEPVETSGPYTVYKIEYAVHL
mgnify:CR=1 FL=1